MVRDVCVGESLPPIVRSITGNTRDIREAAQNRLTIVIVRLIAVDSTGETIARKAVVRSCEKLRIRTKKSAAID